ncbi:C4-dicarboxylate transporter DctQ subunit [Neobacillus niacini]|uniref:TRAP transporter small permease n=1 Tax=Neobacillus niacini TaxID=86668 RepID=UPI00278669B2|nr:TRAP transporter small permease [Neobacillus niacini]MDQ1002654.1 C4-dicarboxylate transporter DctQ subunit [Neobacillus niacini]
MHLFLKTIYKIQHACVYVSSFFMAILAVSVFYDVVARYIFDSPTIWANEISIYLLQFIVFFTMGCIQMEGKQLRVTFLIERLQGIPRKILEALTSLLILPYAIVLVVYGFKFTENAFTLGMGSPTLLEVPLWIPYSFICLGGILLAVAAVCSVIKAWIPQQS